MSVHVQVFGLVRDEESDAPVVVLRAVEGLETLLVQVGLAEAGAIAAAMDRTPFPRPMTHDLLVSVLSGLGATLEKVEVTDLREGTFFGLLHLRKGRSLVPIDCRPSDAIALALRVDAPIFVEDEVFQKAGPQDVTEASRRNWLGFLEALESDDDEGELVQ